MVRTYVPDIAARPYRKYALETLENCLKLVKSGMMSPSEAEREYKICRKTIYNKLKEEPEYEPRKPGGQPVFNKEEEEAFVRNLVLVSEFGFPLTKSDIRFVVQFYLIQNGKIVDKFENGNLPGPDWVEGFLKRHPNLTSRTAINESRNRAAIDRKTLTEYMTNLSKSLEGIPAENIYNYDETNLQDDPGAQKVIVRRGCKYPKKICNSSKTSTSLMMCGSAAGQILPPYVVFKSNSLWDTWTQGGPKGCRYNCSKSGWFDLRIFEDWFENLFLRFVRQKPGKKLLIGDNLSSHFSSKVLRLCREHEIRFVCLPPHSTHLTQPLDVAFFRPLKLIWRKVLRKWKVTKRGQKSTVLQKQDFPRLLKQLIDELLVQGSKNLRSGFAKCGITPFSLEKLLERLPQVDVDQNEVNQSFVTFLTQQRDDASGAVRKRKRRANVIPGRSLAESSSESDVDDPVSDIELVSVYSLDS